jgi:hypothetical protein
VLLTDRSVSFKASVGAEPCSIVNGQGTVQPARMQHAGLLAAAGLLAGAMNAIAGGGSFISFPAMIAAGLPPVIANASSTVALFP